MKSFSKIHPEVRNSSSTLLAETVIVAQPETIQRVDAWMEQQLTDLELKFASYVTKNSLGKSIRQER
ncbi:hypothetical protein LOC68_14830 [Blastopirellula sp. JC732]|uniref:Uncharacterized protein n=1 Tax=Blastopirellula sediminis TaxID=2894196 RepID=A0A9X1SG07_9BACT|nr:hypothetical protein [Blastopirellula sediminis]MCC9607042.1 hypothetical protein [Blastopirellula sediminis]MCC9629665.1 hypothetical protein [Blastopirellula sediminis]